MIRPLLKTYKCLKCGYIKNSHPKSDALIMENITERICPKCQISMEITNNMIDKLIGMLKN